MDLLERVQQRAPKRRNCRSDFGGEAEDWGCSSWRAAGPEGGFMPRMGGGCDEGLRLLSVVPSAMGTH